MKITITMDDAFRRSLRDWPRKASEDLAAELRKQADALASHIAVDVANAHARTVYMGIDLASGPDRTLVKCPECGHPNALASTDRYACQACGKPLNLVGLRVVP